MSTTPSAPIDPTPPPAPVETAPSAIVAEGPALARALGFAGLFLLVLGAVVVVTTRAVGPRWVSEGWGFVFAGFGLVLMLYHAVTDGEQEVRRMYGGLAAGLLVLALAAALLPGPFDATSKTTGYYLLPWGVGAGFLALLFAVPFTRHETDDVLRNVALNALLGVGGLLCVGVVTWGVFKPDVLAGTGLILAVLGLGFVCAFLGQTDTSEGIGYSVALALGAVGAAALFYAFGRTVFPTVLYEGPSALRKANQSLDYWKAVGRILVILVFLGLVALGGRGKFPAWLRGGLALVGLIGAVVFVAASFSAQTTTAPKSFLVPAGLILGGLGALYLAVAVGVCSDNQFVTLIRRELSVYFVSPIGYLVLAGMAGAEWLGYLQFYDQLAEAGRQQRAVSEPIVRPYLFSLFPVISVVFMVPPLTMRLLAEERRSGSLEVLLTSPVNETPVVLSKFLATWFFFLVCWVPAGLYLVALRMELGQPFDYRPLLSFYLALAATGAVFVASGLFFSALTSNQIVAAVFTFTMMLFLLLCFFLKEQTTLFGPLLRQFFARLSYADLWLESLNGQLPIRDVLVWASAAVFGLFLSVKVLEARKWN
jgi:ABC-type transport system involved in multi-copper enzyme maturation permease subunit